MAYRCKSCGYWFKASDSDLCPECFTARDDITCTNYSDGNSAHSHGKFTDADSGDDFLARQIREESKLSGDELLEQMRAYSDTARRSFGSETPPNTYSRSYSAPRPAPSVTPTFTTSSQTSGSGQRVTNTLPKQSPYYQFRTQSQTDTQKKKGNKLAALIVILVFVVPFLSEMIPMLSKLDFSSEQPSEEPQVVTMIRGEEYDPADDPCHAVSDDGELTGALTDQTFHKNYIAALYAAEEYEVSRLSGGESIDESYWHCSTCNIRLDDSDYHVTTIILTGYNDKNGTEFEWEVENDHYGPGNIAFGMPIIFNENIPYYTLDVFAANDSANERRMLTFYLNYDLLAGEIGEHISDEPVGSSHVFDYDYPMGEFESSVKDINNSGMSLKLSGKPREITVEDAGKMLVLEDSGLSTDDWKFVDTILVNKDKNYSPGNDNYVRYSFIGMDAEGVESFYYENVGQPCLPMCSRVQNYRLFVSYLDEDGFDQMADFMFTPNDLYDTAS